jgi:uncharacterized membrane protein (DUF106 family)
MNLFIVLFLVGFVRTLLVIIIIYYGIKIVSKYVLPLLVDKGMKKMQQKMQDQQRQNQKPSRPDGEVTIENDNKKNQNSGKDKGDYVDFEEVE